MRKQRAVTCVTAQIKVPEMASISLNDVPVPRWSPNSRVGRRATVL